MVLPPPQAPPEGESPRFVYRAGMGGEETRTSAQRAFTAYLEAFEKDPELDFESWVSSHPELEDELRTLHQGWLRVRQRLESDEAAATGGDSIGSGLEIQEELGRGGCGVVYRARDRALQRDVALKIIDRQSSSDPDLRQSFLEEARTLAKLDHPNIVRIHAIDETEGQVRLALELIDGRTLEEFVQREGPLGDNEASQVGIELCHALAELHAKDLVHMDVKPGNAMRKSGGRIVLLDFGFARANAPTPDDDEGGRRGGTPPFMSPEHLGASPPDARTDVFSLGATLYWCVSRRYPYHFEDRLDLFEKILQGQVTPLRDVRPDVSTAFADVIEKAMQAEPEDRYASAGEMERALRAVIEESRATKARGSYLGPMLLVAALVLIAFLLRSTIFSDGFDVEARFQKHVAGQEPLVLGETSVVAVDDELFLEVESEEPFYLYVFNEDDQGRWFRLWPDDGKGSRRLLPGIHRLPGPDPAYDFWIVDTSAGREHVFLVASKDPDPFAEALVALIPPPSEEIPFVPTTFQCRELEDELLRGIGKTQVASESKTEKKSLLDYFFEFEKQASHRTNVHYRHLQWAHDK